ncbi:hypothetical protein LCGC14_2691620, partial [marine sediment metagenome]
VFQNIPDVGDGSPGIQRCFRNYLHEGGIEKDLQLLGFGIKGTSVDINNAELQQLSNIGASVITTSIWTQLNNISTSVITASIWAELSNISTTTISAAQWIYVGGADQPLKQADSVQFGGLALTGNLTIAGNSITGTSVNINNAELQQLSNIGSATISGTQWGYLGNSNQNVRTTDSPTFVNPIVTNLNLADDIIHVGDTNNLISFGIDTQDFQTGGSSRMDISDSGLRIGGANVRVTGIIDNNSLGTSDVVLCTQGNVKAYVDNKLPIGFIAMYSGAWTDNTTIPGWYKCDGNNGTVNLVDKFVRGGTTSGASGGSDDAIVVQHNHGITDPEHNHNLLVGAGPGIISGVEASNAYTTNLFTGGFIQSKPVGITVNNEGVSGVNANIPTYYQLIFIQRIS